MKATNRILSASILILTLLSQTIFPCASDARRKGFRLKDNNEQVDTELVAGSFMVASQCEDCNNGYRIDQISFSGFDKPQNSSKESFFITNNTDRQMTGVTLYIEYLTEDGRQLHKRFLRLSCDIPAGETRQAVVESWDKQHSFRYTRSAAPARSPHPATAFIVRFDPVSFYLRL